MTPDASPLVVRGLGKHFGATVALDDVSLDVRPAELFGLVGPDGGGKTTLFRILTTLLVPDTGTATVLGLDVVRDLWAIRARVGYMPGRFSLYPDLSVEENLAFFASVFGTSIEEGYALIAPVYRQIEPFRDRRAGALSGGMKQKLALSCALVHRPDILFLDEPTTGVDAVSRREFWDLLDALKASGLTIIVSTPYMDEADRCDRVALVQRGRVLAVDAPAAIGARFPRPLLAVRGGDRHALLLALRAHPHAASVFPFGEELHYSDARVDLPPPRVADDVHAWLAGRGFATATVRRRADARGGRMSAAVAPGSAPAITVRGLTRRFGAFTAVDGITFGVAAGEVFGFLGANGAGKTTAIKILIGLLAPSAGEARVAGFDVMTQADEVRRRIGYMSQRFSLYEDLTVRENITLYGGIYGLTDQVIAARGAALLEELRLAHAADTLVGALPLGWKQKLAFSVAMLHAPAIVFLDEPTGGVDPVTRRQFWELIYAAAARGTTVFVTTHYLDEAAYCDRVSIMVAGRIGALGTPAELKAQFGVETLDEVFVRCCSRRACSTRWWGSRSAP
jgi:ABC-2 type transport system ATP-binding protein